MSSRSSFFVSEVTIKEWKLFVWVKSKRDTTESKWKYVSWPWIEISKLKISPEKLKTLNTPNKWKVELNKMIDSRWWNWVDFWNLVISYFDVMSTDTSFLELGVEKLFEWDRFTDWKDIEKTIDLNENSIESISNGFSFSTMWEHIETVWETIDIVASTAWEIAINVWWAVWEWIWAVAEWVWEAIWSIFD